LDLSLGRLSTLLFLLSMFNYFFLRFWVWNCCCLSFHVFVWHFEKPVASTSLGLMISDSLPHSIRLHRTPCDPHVLRSLCRDAQMWSSHLA
jgi:hypothetical protein